MHPVRNIEALVLLAVARASKRHPAELVEIIAALELLEGRIAPEARLCAALQRLAAHDLLIETDGRLSLSAAAQPMLTGVPRKADTRERIVIVREELAADIHPGDAAGLELTPDDVATAIAEHRRSATDGRSNLLMPKPKPKERDQRRGGSPAGHKRKPGQPRRRRD